MSFFALMPAVAKISTTTAPALPVFKRRWWYSCNKLDARPLLWSLRNRPSEWYYVPEHFHSYFEHKPSKHRLTQVISLAMSRMYDWRLSAECSCSGSEFQLGQQQQINREIGRLLASRVSAQFAAHFIH